MALSMNVRMNVEGPSPPVRFRGERIQLHACGWMHGCLFMCVPPLRADTLGRGFGFCLIILIFIFHI